MWSREAGWREQKQAFPGVGEAGFSDTSQWSGNTVLDVLKKYKENIRSSLIPKSVVDKMVAKTLRKIYEVSDYRIMSK